MANFAWNFFPVLWCISREFFTLRAAERSISNLSLIDRIEIRGQVQLAVRTMRKAQRTRTAALRIQLARTALRGLIEAVAAARLKSRSPTPVDWPGFARAIQAIAELPQIGRYEEALRLVVGAGHVPMLANRHFLLMSDLFAYLEEVHTETRTPRAFRLARVLRASCIFAALLCCSWVVITPRNLARDKSVSSSSLCSDMPAAPIGAPRLSRVVDGIQFEVRRAACTEKELAPWFTVDLGSPHSIKSIVIYPRTDGFWYVDEPPFVVQLSQDNEHFRTEETRTVPFAPDAPWRVVVQDKIARYVRFAGGADKQQQLIVNEIEVYGR